MKKSPFKRLSSFILALVMIATVLVAVPTTATADDGGTLPANDPNAVNLGIEYTYNDINVSYLKRLETVENGVHSPLPVGTSTNAIHGGHHTRVLRTPYGTYAVIITNTEVRDGQVMELGSDGNYVAIDLEAKYGDNYPYWYQGINHYSVVRITDDGVEVLFEDVCPENQSSHVPEIYAGDDGRFFVCLPAEDPETYAKNLVAYNYGLIPESQFKNAALLKVQEFDAVTGELISNNSTIIPFDTVATQDHGYGKPSACVDTVARKIYFSYNGAAGPAYFAMFIYDMDTGEFDPTPHTLTIPYRRDYYNMYPDGNGGMFFIIERCNAKVDAAALLGILFNNNNSFAWDGCIFYHIYDIAAITYSNDADLDRELYGYKEVAIELPDYLPPPDKNVVDSISHYGENGCTYLDDQNRLHVIFTHGVGNDKTTTVYHVVLDTDGNELFRQKIPTTLLPKNGTKTFKGSCGYVMTQGADGTYYIVRFVKAATATIDVWTSPANDGLNFKKAFTDHQLVTKDGTAVSMGYPIVGNSRDGSIRDGVIPILFHSTTGAAAGSPDAYYYFAIQICDHDYAEEVTEPTCTGQGYTTRTCSKCGHSYVVEDSYVDALGHDYVTEVTEPTCTEQGYTTYTCSRCGDTYIDEDSYVDAPGHDYVATVTEPNCTEQGYTTYTCSRCGDNYIDEDSYVDALGHDYVETVVEPTCTEQGYTSLKCSRCGDEHIDEDSYADALGHDYVAVVTEPTCTEQGFTTHTCSRCGDNFIDTYVDPQGHDYGDWIVTTEPTCTEAGEKTKVCASCGDTLTEPVDALGHDYAAVVTEPTCTEQGFTTHTCSRCGDSFVDTYVDALGHDWDEGTVTTPATSTEDGVMTYTCRRCSETKTEVIPKTGVEIIDTTKIFKDVKAGKWYTDAVNYVYTYGLMNGMTEDTFAPNADMSRAMLVTVLWRAEGSPAPKGSAPFTDLKAKWYKEAVAWAYENKIVNGTSATTFSPDQSITREQIAAIFYRYAEFKGRDTSGAADITKFPDGSKVSKYAKTAMSWAVAEGLISGTKINGKDYLDPKGNATRAQVATILMRYLESNPAPKDPMYDIIAQLDYIMDADEASRLRITFQTSSTVNADNLASIILAGTGLDPETYEVLVEDPEQIDDIRAEYGGLGFAQELATDEVGFAIRNKVTGEVTDYEYYTLRLLKDVKDWTGAQVRDNCEFTYLTDAVGALADEDAFAQWIKDQLNEVNTLPDYNYWTITIKDFAAVKAAYDAMIASNEETASVTVDFDAFFEIPLNDAHLEDPTYPKSCAVTFVAPAPV